MSCVKMVTGYPDFLKRHLVWEIQNVCFLINKCDDCWADEAHAYCSQSTNLKSDVFQLPVEGGTVEKWHFLLSSDKGALMVYLSFDGLFGSDGSLVKNTQDFDFFVNMTKSSLSQHKSESFGTTSGRLFKTMSGIDLQRIPTDDLKSIWPHGNITVSLELFQVSHMVHQVSSGFDSPFLEPVETELKDSVASCYGNLLNNPDLSDFKILCKDSAFHAHKFILSARSRVFRTMIESGLSQLIKIEDMTPKTLSLMLEHIYKGTVEHFPEDLKEKIELLDSAEKYELDGLKSICMRKLFSASSLSMTLEKDVGKLAIAASVYGANEGATKIIKDICTKNHAQLIKNPEYKRMFLAKPQMFME